MSNEDKIIMNIKRLLADEPEITQDILDKKYDEHKNMGIDVLSLVLGLSNNSLDWDNIWIRIQEEVQVKHQKGFGINDSDQRYDKEWFSDLLRNESTGFYWSRFVEYQRERLPQVVIRTLKHDTENMLNLCGSPNRKEVKDIRGLVFGFVQSGKTLNYSSVSNAAMDSGYDIIVILAGATNILRKQTQERVNSDIIGAEGRNIIGVGKIVDKMEKRPISLTNKESDFSKIIANQQLNGVNLSNVTSPVIAVIKKNVSTLKNLNSWLDVQNQRGVISKAILLIDDESDYASVNTKEVEDPTAINTQLRKMLNHFDVSTYLAITATPFANILINYQNEHNDLGEDLFPRSFIWTLKKPSTYVGVEEVVIGSFRDIQKNKSSGLLEDQQKQICNSILKYKKQDKFTELPYFLTSAIADFIFNLVLLRQKRVDLDDLSMMVNVSRFTDHHEQLSALVETEVDNILRQLESLKSNMFTSEILLDIKERYEKDKGLFISEKDFWTEIIVNCRRISVIDIHMRSRSELVYGKGKKINFIVVGGLSLSRGFTVEGLMTSVFLRSTRTYDTLMQMGRWFGHKSYMLEHLSLYTTSEIQRRYEAIEEATNDLIDQIGTMRERGETPRDFGLGIKYDPNVAMQVVAYNKAKGAERVSVRLGMGGRLCETTRLFNDTMIVQSNFDSLNRFIESVMQTGVKVTKESGYYIPAGNDKFVYTSVPVDIVISFLEAFKIPFKKLSQMSSKMPYYFLLKYLNNGQILDVDVALVEGDAELEYIPGIGKVKMNERLFDLRDWGGVQQKKNQLSKPTDESILLKEKIGTQKGTRKEARTARRMQGNRPLLLIYPLLVKVESSDGAGVLRSKNIGWSLVTPGEATDLDSQLVFANKVLVDQLNEEDESYFEELEVTEQWA